MQDRRKEQSVRNTWAMMWGRFWDGAWVYVAITGLLILVSLG